MLILFCCILLVAGCDASKQLKAEPNEVLYSVVGEEKITLTSTLPGRVSALVTAEVRPQVDGIIIERLFEEGADVKKGQVLYRIDPAVHKAAYAMAKASLVEAQANVAAIALLEKRQRLLISQNALSRQELDNTISQHGQARARVARAKAELESAAINLAYTEIKAPVAGHIGASSVTVGALVTANQPTALAVIQQTDRVYVDITQSSTDTIRLRRAMAQGRMAPNGSATKVRLTLEDGSPYTAITRVQTDGEPEWIQGDLLFSEISVDQSTGSLILRAVFNNPDRLLLPGMYVKAIIEEGAVDNAVLIPQGLAFANNTGGHSVYVLRGDDAENGLFRVERRDVRLERASGNRWIVSSGLNSGDILIVEGLQKAAPGELVKGVPTRKAPTEAVAMTSKKKAR
ncbi:efflux RND transporter periplasmic adaptor subunit [Desulfovibrio inopinatus]|uniref:efflux RND transporter periplasmic adaptor subunit n=1 Tax=Desulfovibrio inopinatus TaxID=102109 RepID=UPI000421605B|nr:efflux RND transporter periplasmic adaptor subunit [Desulfovibrio inopinatus]